MDVAPVKEIIQYNGFQWLSNDVHPIFKEANFKADFDYQDLSFALRFASMFLQTDRLLPFWWNLLEGRSSATAKGSTIGEGTRRILDEPPETLTPEQIETTKNFLENLSNHVGFYVDHNEKSEPQCKSDYETTTTSPYATCNSKIHIPARDLNLLKTDVNSTDPIRQAAASFTFGIALLHEIVHAATARTRHRSDRDSLFIGKDTVAEEGLAFETRMFGGEIKWYRDHPDQAVHYSVNGADGPHGFDLELEDWPNACLVQIYGRSGAHALDVLEEPPGVYCVWDVSPSFALKMMDEEFWGKVSTEGLSVLRVPRTNGYAVAQREDCEWRAIAARDAPEGTFQVGHRITAGGFLVVCRDPRSAVTGD